MTEVKLAHLVECSNVKATGVLAPYVALEHVESGTGQLMSRLEIEEREADGVLFESGDVLFGKLRPYLHKVLKPDFSGVCSSELLVLRPGRGLDSRYLYYLALTRRFADWASASSYGVKMPRTSWELLRQLPVGVPGLAEQRAIADYLDTETARIDALIAKKRRIIELLEERVRVAAVQATTTGTPTELRRYLRRVQTGGTPGGDAAGLIREEGEVEWATPGDFGASLSLLPTARRVDRQAVVGGHVPLHPMGSVLVVGIGATAGKVAYADRPVASNQQVTGLVSTKGLSGRFLAWALLARGDEMRLTAPYTTLPILNNEFLKSLRLNVPTFEDQVRIARKLDTLAETTTILTGRLHEQGQLLVERRQSLITAAVTGAVEVPEVAA